MSHNTDKIAIVLLLAVCLSFALFLRIRPHGDGSTYYLMTASLLYDGDTKLDGRDIARWQKDSFQNFPAGAYVAVRGENLFFAKPLAYPLVAVPFFLVWGPAGFLILNGLLLGGCVIFPFLFLKRYLNRWSAAVITLLFFFCSYLPAYVSWIHPEMLLFFACSLCLWLMVTGRPATAALIIGLAAGIKPVFLILLIPLVARSVQKRRSIALAGDLGWCACGIILIAAFTAMLHAPAFPYAGVRGYIPYTGEGWLNSEHIRRSLVILPTPFIGFGHSGPGLWALECFYFFFGRFTGVFWYAFPAVICVIAYMLKRRSLDDARRLWGDSLLSCFLMLAVVLIVARPLNYFGGRECIGNRYLFLAPLFLFLPVLSSARARLWLALCFIPGLLVSAPLFHAEASFKGNILERTLARTRRFPLSFAPFEAGDAEFLLLYERGVQGGRWFSTDRLQGSGMNVVSPRAADIVFVADAAGREFVPETGGKRIAPFLTLGPAKSFYLIRARAGQEITVTP